MEPSVWSCSLISPACLLFFDLTLQRLLFMFFQESVDLIRWWWAQGANAVDALVLICV